MEAPDMAHRMHVSFEGELHTVRAGAFMTALAADMEILTTVNKALSGGTRNIEVNISAPERGSFEFWIEVVGIGLGVPGLFGVDGYAYLASLVSMYKDVHALKRFLGGSTPVAEHVEGDKVTLTNTNGDIFHVGNLTYNIYFAEPTIDKALAEKFTELEQETQITGLSISAADLEPLHVTRTDFPQLKQRSPQLATGERTIVEEAQLYPVSFSTEGEAGWLAYHRGEKIRVYLHNATYNGRRFYDILQEGHIRFGCGDRMHVTLEIRQQYDAQIGTYINKVYSVTEIHAYYPRQEQGRLGL